MPDFYVNAATGDDANPGSAGAPVASITRATELAAAVEPEGGTIFVAEGTYGVPRERFPILVPPAFAIEGASRESCIIAFSGEARTSDDGDLYWGGVALQGGTSVQGLTLRSDAIPESYSCAFTIGLDMMNETGEVRDLAVLSSDPGNPRDTFGLAVFLEGASARLADLQIRQEGMVSCGGDHVEVDRLDTVAGSLSFGARTGHVQDCRFEDASISVSSASAGEIRNNSLEGHGFRIVVGSRAESPPPGPGPLITGHVLEGGHLVLCRGPGTCRIEGNELTNRYAGATALLVTDGATPQIRDNTIRAAGGTGLERLMVIEEGAEPLIERNVFEGHVSVSFDIRSPADFGGGAMGSAGQNHFGPCLWSQIRADIPGGGVIHAEDNFWPTWAYSDAEAAVLRGIVQEEPGTEVRVDGAMDDPLGRPGRG